MGWDDEALRRMLAGLLGKDEGAYDEFWAWAGPRLCAISDHRLPAAIRRRLGAEDVVQSALRTFIRRAQAGQIQLTDGEKLWRLLCAITLNKLREKVRFHLRQRRSVAREGPPSGASDDTRREAMDPAATIASPDEAAVFADSFEKVMATLDAKQQTYVQLKLEDYSASEIARALGCSDRTVRNIARRVQSRLRHLLTESWPGDDSSGKGFSARDR